MIKNNLDFKREFTELTKEHKAKDKLQSAILGFSGKSHNCAVCLVDMIGSTKLAAKIPDSKASIFYSTYLNSLIDIVEKNNGHVVKSIGDALLYYFDNSVENYFEVTLRCGLEIIEKRDTINDTLNENNLPSISYRVSSDYGRVMLGNSSVSVVDDIFGSVVNMCSKINRLANPNQMIVGNDFHLMAKSLNGFQFKEIKSNIDIGLKNKYPVFNVRKN